MGSLFGKQGIQGFFNFGKKGSKDQNQQQVNAPDVTSGGDDADQERLKRVGRAQLISSSQRGVLSNGETSNKKLFGV